MSPACRANRLPSSTGLRTQLSPADQPSASRTTSKLPSCQGLRGCQSGRRMELALSPNANDCGRTMIPMAPSQTKACCAKGLSISNSSCQHPNDGGTGQARSHRSRAVIRTRAIQDSTHHPPCSSQQQPALKIPNKKATLAGGFSSPADPADQRGYRAKVLPGIELFLQGATPQLSSPLLRFTTEFEMDRCGSTAPWTPG